MSGKPRPAGAPVPHHAMAPPPYTAAAGAPGIDDFKYGVNVASADVPIRLAFLRKVYLLLSLQLLCTAAIAGLMSSSETCRTWLRANPWSVYAAVASSVAALLALYCRRRAYPANLLLLAAFTAAEAFTVGSVVAFTDRTALLHALLLSLSSSVALTLYTLQTRRDFSGLAPYLFALLAACLAAGVVRAFRPFSRSTDLLFACGGAAAFGGYIVHDTQAMMRRVSPEEYVVAAVDLYLDVVNLFLQVLRIVQDLRG